MRPKWYFLIMCLFEFQRLWVLSICARECVPELSCCLSSIKTPKVLQIFREHTVYSFFWGHFILGPGRGFSISVPCSFICPSSYPPSLWNCLGWNPFFSYAWLSQEDVASKYFTKKWFLWKIFVAEMLLKTTSPALLRITVWQGRQRASTITEFYKNLKKQSKMPKCAILG